MATPYTLKWDQTFGNSKRNLFFKQLIKCPRILSTLKRASIGDFPSNISAVRAIAKGPQLYTSVCFWTDRCMNTFSIYPTEGRFQTITNLDPSIATKSQ